MAERPPPGYNKRDKPLHHSFYYSIGLRADSSQLNKSMMTFLRTTLDSVDPATINVNPRNSAFAVETSPTICFDSIIQMMTITQSIFLSEAAIATDKINQFAFYDWNIHGAFEDSWTPADEKTTTTIAQLLHVTSDTTKEDVVPEVNGVKITGKDQPVSNKVFPTEAFGDYNLTTNKVPEGTTDDFDMIDEIFDAKQYYTNGGKLNSLMGKINKTILTNHKRQSLRFEKRFTPKNVRFGNPHLFFGRQLYLPKVDEKGQLMIQGGTVGAAPQVGIKTNVRFNEWNPDFDQSRM